MNYSYIYNHHSYRNNLCTVNNKPTMKVIKMLSQSNPRCPSSTTGKSGMRKLRKMVLIEVYTGSRKRIDKKMELLKEKSGLTVPGTSVTGETTARKASVSNSTKMVINMKECGQWIKNMDKELTGDSTGAS